MKLCEIVALEAARYNFGRETKTLGGSREVVVLASRRS